jgi:hypothetical protein
MWAGVATSHARSCAGIPRPALGCVEGDDPNRIVVLARQLIIDDGF